MLTAAQRSDFDERGFVRIAAAFSTAEAAAMQDLVWDELSRHHGISRSDPATWLRQHPSRFQRITDSPMFAPIGGPTLLAAIDDLLGVGTWQVPKRWGAILVTFPLRGCPWTLPSAVWHVDFSYALPPDPLPGIQLFTCLSDVPARGGGTLVVAGSHRLIERFVQGRAAAMLKNTRRTRIAFFASHPWLRELVSPGLRELVSPDGSSERVEKFIDAEERIEGVPVRVAELTGTAGDVLLTHPWLVHCRAPNCADTPRFMRSKSILRDSPALSTHACIVEGET
jgi:hypothetical protein